MKKIIVGSCMNYLKNTNHYSDKELAKIEYGLLGIYLTLSKTLFVLIVALILGILKEVIIFMAIYGIIRATAFGLHASKSWICLISSTIIFIGFPTLAIKFKIPIIIKKIIAILGILLMFKNAPADTYKRPIVNIKRRNIYKFLSVIITITYSFLTILIKDSFISNCFLFAIVLQNIMISPVVYKIFNLPYNNYINYLKLHPELQN